MSAAPPSTGMRRSRVVLCVALFALSVLYSLWFHGDKHQLATLLVFTLPPLLALAAVLRGGALAAFWTGVVSLLWFCHAVMIAWSRPADGLYAWTAIALSLVIVLAASWPGLQGRFARRASTPAATGAASASDARAPASAAATPAATATPTAAPTSLSTAERPHQ